MFGYKLSNDKNVLKVVKDAVAEFIRKTSKKRSQVNQNLHKILQTGVYKTPVFVILLLSKLNYQTTTLTEVKHDYHRIENLVRKVGSKWLWRLYCYGKWKRIQLQHWRGQKEPLYNCIY